VGHGYDTPEAATLSRWTPEWQAYVIETRYESEDEATVFVDTIPSHPMEVICDRRDGKWTSVRGISDWLNALDSEELEERAIVGLAAARQATMARQQIDRMVRLAGRATAGRGVARRRVAPSL
jgi:hypothetical protein